jgi:hypothetical protein
VVGLEYAPHALVKLDQVSNTDFSCKNFRHNR